MIRHFFVIFGALTLFSFAELAYPTSIQKLDFETLADMSELIFEGQVVAVDARWNAQKSRIHTYVTFSVADVVKGKVKGSRIELRFAGGDIDGQSFVYQGLVYPKVGEQGIYFVETTKRNLVNPLVGWSQGHYKVRGSKMMTNNDKPVKAIRRSLKVKAGELSEGVANGVAVGSARESGMTKSEFKAQIKARLNR